MRALFTLLISAALLLPLAGCDFIRTPGMRQDWLSKHPLVVQNRPRIAQAIAEGKITDGMTKEEVLASWGYPHTPLGNPIIRTRWAETWIYQMYPDVAGTYITFGPDGKVVNFLATY